MKPDQIALLLMAGGRSDRFGHSDKLLAELNGMPLGLHMAHRLTPMTWGARIAVANATIKPLLSRCGFEVIAAGERAGLGDNLSAGVSALRNMKAVIIILADMPFVSRRHIEAMIFAAKGPRALVVSRNHGNASPPVLFGRDYFHDLISLRGDEGARHVFASRLTEVTWIEADAGELCDIDTVADLNRAQPG